MPNFRPSPDLDMHYEVDDFVDPWRRPQTVLMLHGNAESSLAWWGWVPRVAREFRVVRPDMRGFGESTAMPEDYPWTLDRLVEDFCQLMDHLGIARFHLVGAKIGGTIARAFAARRPDRVITLTVVGTPPPFRVGAAERVPELVRDFQTHGVEYWARQNMGDRLGGAFPPDGFEWWCKFMGRTAVSTQIGFMATIACADIRADMTRITCPTLSSPPSKAASALSRKPVSGSSRSRIPNYWCCRVIPIMSPRLMPIARPMQRWISSRGVAGRYDDARSIVRPTGTLISSWCRKKVKNWNHRCAPMHTDGTRPISVHRWFQYCLPPTDEDVTLSGTSGAAIIRRRWRKSADWDAEVAP